MSLTCWTAKSRMLAPATATRVTRKTPISRALAVVAVRLGLRTELSTASRPSMPNRSSSGPRDLAPPGRGRALRRRRRHERRRRQPDGGHARSRRAFRPGRGTARTTATTARPRPSDADSVAASRIASIGSVRARPTRGDHHRQHRDDRAEEHPADDVAGVERQTAGQAVAGERQHPLEREGQEVAGHDTEDRPEDAEHDTLEPQRAFQLPRRRTDRGQHRELAQSLGHDDGEGVVDDEAADEQGQDRERLQRLLQRLGERPVGRALVLAELVTGLDVEAVGHHLAGLGDQVVGVRATQVVGVVLLLAGVQPGEGVGLGDRDGAAAVEGVGVAELGDARPASPAACRPA